MVKKSVVWIILAIIIIFIVLVVALFELMGGQIVTSRQTVETVQGSSLVCKSKNVYPIFSYDLSKDKELKIIVGFYNNKINAISLTYDLYYDDAKQIMASETNNHAAMNIDFSKNNLSSDSYNANYSKLEDRMRMALYTNVNEVDNNIARYFLINLDDKSAIPRTLVEYQKNYETQDFTCEINNN